VIQRVLIVGSGSAGKKHLEVARQMLPQADLRVLRRHRANEESNLSNGCFYEVEAALQFSPQIAVIANPAPLHVEISNRLASAGCHLLIEKPIAESTLGVEKLIRKAEDLKIVLQVGYNLRFLSCLQEFRRQIHMELIGRVLSVHVEVGQFLPSWRPREDYRKTVSANAELGGGVLLELSHEIDYMRWIFGEIAWVNAWTGRVGELQINVEDSAKIILGFKESGIFSRGVATMSMDFIRKDPVRNCLAVGSQSSLRWNGIGGTVEKYSTESKSWVTIFKKENAVQQTYVSEWKSFLDSVDSDQRPEVTGYDGLAVLKVVEAAKLSHQQNGRRIHITKK